MGNRVRELARSSAWASTASIRGCDLVALKVRDVWHGDQVASRAVVMQHKTQRSVQFEITPAAHEAVQKWIETAGLKSDDFLFPSRIHGSPHLATRQYAQILEGWVEELGLDLAEHGRLGSRSSIDGRGYSKQDGQNADHLQTFHECRDYRLPGVRHLCKSGVDGVRPIVNVWGAGCNARVCHIHQANLAALPTVFCNESRNSVAVTLPGGVIPDAVVPVGYEICERNADIWLGGVDSTEQPIETGSYRSSVGIVVNVVRANV